MNKKPLHSKKNIESAIKRAEQKCQELPIVVQVSESDWDVVILADEINTLRDDIIYYTQRMCELKNQIMHLCNAITDALKEMDKCPDDSVQDIWNEALESWGTELSMDHNFVVSKTNYN